MGQEPDSSRTLDARIALLHSLKLNHTEIQPTLLRNADFPDPPHEVKKRVSPCLPPPCLRCYTHVENERERERERERKAVRVNKKKRLKLVNSATVVSYIYLATPNF
jgi:hypothetical protein